MTLTQAEALSSPPLARCPFKACPVRYRTGHDRLCAEHDDSNATRFAAAELGIDLGELAQAAPGDRGGGRRTEGDHGDGW